MNILHTSLLNLTNSDLGKISEIQKQYSHILQPLTTKQREREGGRERGGEGGRERGERERDVHRCSAVQFLISCTLIYHWGHHLLRMCLRWSLCAMCLLACQVGVTIDNSGLCWVHVTSAEP